MRKSYSPISSTVFQSPTNLFWVFDRNRDVKFVLLLLFLFFFQLQQILNRNLVSLSRHTSSNRRGSNRRDRFIFTSSTVADAAGVRLAATDREDAGAEAEPWSSTSFFLVL